MLRDGQNRTGWVNLSGWCRDQQIDGRAALINSDVVRASLGWSKPKLVDRAERLLRWHSLALELRPDSRDRLDLPLKIAMGVSYSDISEQVSSLLRLMLDRDWLSRGSIANRKFYFLAPVGRLHLEELELSSLNSATAFVAMWFSNDLQQSWEEGFKVALTNVGYDPIRVDEIEHVGRIDDQIMNQIRKSRFVVADFTGHRGGVYFEAGYAMGLGIPVFWTCRADDIDNLHFDIRQYNNIVWKSSEELRLRLEARVENVVGMGPRARS